MPRHLVFLAPDRSVAQAVCRLLDGATADLHAASIIRRNFGSSMSWRNSDRRTIDVRLAYDDPDDARMVLLLAARRASWRGWHHDLHSAEQELAALSAQQRQARELLRRERKAAHG